MPRISGRSSGGGELTRLIVEVRDDDIRASTGIIYGATRGLTLDSAMRNKEENGMDIGLKDGVH